MMRFVSILLFFLCVSTTASSNSTYNGLEIIRIPSNQKRSSNGQCNCLPSRFLYRRYQDPIKFEVTQVIDSFIKIPGLMMAVHHSDPMIFQIRYQGASYIANGYAFSITTILIDNRVLTANQLFPNNNRRHELASKIGGNEADYRGGKYWHSGGTSGLSLSSSRTELVLLPAGVHVIEVGVRAINTQLHLWGGELIVEVTEYDSRQYSSFTFPTVWD